MENGREIRKENLGKWNLCSQGVNSNFIWHLWIIKIILLCLAKSHLCSVKLAQGHRQMGSLDETRQRAGQSQLNIFSICICCWREGRKAALQGTEVRHNHWQVLQLTQCLLVGALVSASWHPWLAIAFHVRQLTEASAWGRHTRNFPYQI